MKKFPNKHRNIRFNGKDFHNGFDDISKSEDKRQFLGSMVRGWTISRRSFGINQRRHVANALRNPGWPCHIATVRVSGRKPLFKFANYLMIGQSRTRPLQFSTASRFPITSAKFSCRRDVIALAARNGHQTVHQTNFPSLIIFGIRLVLLEQIWNYNL